MRAAAACDEATGEVALSVAHATITAATPAKTKILSGLIIVSLQVVTARTCFRAQFVLEEKTRQAGRTLRCFFSPISGVHPIARAPGVRAARREPDPSVSQ